MWLWFLRLRVWTFSVVHWGCILPLSRPCSKCACAPSARYFPPPTAPHGGLSVSSTCILSFLTSSCLPPPPLIISHTHELVLHHLSPSGDCGFSWSILSTFSAVYMGCIAPLSKPCSNHACGTSASARYCRRFQLFIGAASHRSLDRPKSACGPSA